MIFKNKYFDPIFFFGAFIIGLLLNYLNSKSPNIVIKYPTPYNNHIYKDDSDNCYKYNLEKTECIAENNMFNVPIQTLK